MIDRKSIDWEQVRVRLDTQQAEFEQGRELTSEQLQEALARRAQELASRSRQDDTRSNDSWSGLIFTLDREKFCLPLSDLAEVFPCTQCTPVPGGPAELCGLVNVRGEICSVLDLARILNLPAVPERPTGYILLIRRPGMLTGFRVDELEKIEVTSPETQSGIDGDAPGAGRTLRTRTAGRATVLHVKDLLARWIH